MSREFPVKEFAPIEDGKHKGRILRIEYRDENSSPPSTYAYVDFVIVLEDSDGVELKYGCPQTVSEKSKFGKLLQLFGKSLIKDDKIKEEEIEGLFKNKYVEFITITEPVIMKDGQKREFARIVDNSVKPCDEKPVIETSEDATGNLQ